ncbi:MAG TPA: sensor histidine kinase [Gaiellaceae bacterium]|jgi:signal transduction histidine kinase
MRHDRFESFLWGQVLLILLLAASLGLFVSYPSLRTSYDLPELRLVLATVFMLAAALVAALAGTRFAAEGRRFDCLLAAGFAVTSLSWLVFTVAPGVSGNSELSASTAGRALGWVFIAAAPFAVGRVEQRRKVLWWSLGVAAVGLIPIWNLSRSVHNINGLLALLALLQLVAVVAFSNRYRLHGEDLDQWLSYVATLTLFASLGEIFTQENASTTFVRTDVLVLVANGILLVGLWRAIRAYEFGRVVAEERARVAREIHDGLAQYLFAVSTHASMLEAGADPGETLPYLKEAALLAQQEARYAILALSSAAGRAPFDSALRRYVDVLTADGVLDVELEIDPHVQLGPDEQIEIFRIVQEGLANVRKHSDAHRAVVEIGGRGNDRYVRVRDNGDGFDLDQPEAGEGLRNMRDRAESIGGALSLRSTPGRGTALEVVLRA